MVIVGRSENTSKNIHKGFNNTGITFWVEAKFLFSKAWHKNKFMITSNKNTSVIYVHTTCLTSEVEEWGLQRYWTKWFHSTNVFKSHIHWEQKLYYQGETLQANRPFQFSGFRDRLISFLDKLTHYYCTKLTHVPRLIGENETLL